MFSSFSVVSAYCVIQLFSSHTIFPFVKQRTLMCLQRSVSDKEEKAKLNQMIMII